MKQKFGNRGIVAGVLSVIIAVCLALGVYFLLPDSAAVYADEAVNETIVSHSSSEHAESGWSDMYNSGDVTTVLSNGNYYYLSKNLEISNGITVSGTVYLCLNGYAIVYKNTTASKVITVNSEATLILCDCGGQTEQTHSFYLNNGLYTYCYSTNGSCSDQNSHDNHETITDGVITGGGASGGGVYINSSAKFYMYGGTIIGNGFDVNSGGTQGGGVYVNGGEFYMYNGAAITGNGYFTYRGGGVYVASGKFEMHGGTISYNISIGQSTSAGGVYVNGGEFYMYDGSISYNTAGDYGGGVYVNSNGTFIMEGGEISNNNAENSDSYGGGVCVYGTFEMRGGTISDNTASYGSGVLVYYSSGSSGTFTMNGGYLDGEVYNYSEHIEVPGGVSAHGKIEINGGYLSQTAYSTVTNEENEENYISESSEEIDTGDALWVYAILPTDTPYTDTEATCTKDGERTYTYEIEGHTYTITVALKATGHTITHAEYKAASETEDGNYEYWYCENCDKYFSNEDYTEETSRDDLKIPATGTTGSTGDDTAGDDTTGGDAASSSMLAHYIMWGCIGGVTVVGVIIAAIYIATRRFG